MSTLIGCAATANKIPVVDKGVPVSSLTLADHQLRRHMAPAPTPVTETAPAAQVFVPKASSGLSVTPLREDPIAQRQSAAPVQAIAAMPVGPADPVKRAPAPATPAAKPATPIQPAPVVVDVQMRIHKLTEGYIQGNLEDAYELGKLLYQQGRAEEADVALDYAARQGHIPSMMLYSERLKKNGQHQLAEHWLTKARKAQ